MQMMTKSQMILSTNIHTYVFNLFKIGSSRTSHSLKGQHCLHDQCDSTGINWFGWTVWKWPWDNNLLIICFSGEMSHIQCVFLCGILENCRYPLHITYTLYYTGNVTLQTQSIFLIKKQLVCSFWLTYVASIHWCSAGE